MSSRRARSGGTRHVDDGEAVVEVLAERPLVDLAREGRGCVAQTMRTSTSSAFGAPTRRTSARLERAEELRLHRERHLADLVEEERAAVRLLEGARAVRDGAGEGAAHVAEELALEQVLRDRAAVDRQRRAPSRAARPRAPTRATTSLPVPVSPCDEQRRAALRDALERGVDAAHLEALAHELAELARGH